MKRCKHYVGSMSIRCKAEPKSCPKYIHSRPKADAIYLKGIPTRLRADPKQIQSLWEFVVGLCLVRTVNVYSIWCIDLVKVAKMFCILSPFLQKRFFFHSLLKVTVLSLVWMSIKIIDISCSVIKALARLAKSLILNF